MGCWNKTCGLSNLHITAGTPVYVFVLERNEQYDACYASCLFTPVLLPFESVYDHYGGGEDSSGPGLLPVMEGIKKYLVELEQGENPYHDIPVKKEGFGPDEFFKTVHEGRLAYQRQFSTTPTELYFTMFRKDVVDAVLEDQVIEEYVGDGKGTYAKWGDEKNYTDYKFADIIASLRPLLIQLAESVATDEMYRFFLFSKIGQLRSQNYAAKWLSYSGNQSNLVNVEIILGNLLYENTPESLDQAESLLTEFLKGNYINSFMHGARKVWIPGGHEGSQSESGDSLRLLGKIVNTVLDREHEDEDE